MTEFAPRAYGKPDVSFQRVLAKMAERAARAAPIAPEKPRARVPPQPPPDPVTAARREDLGMRVVYSQIHNTTFGWRNRT